MTFYHCSPSSLFPVARIVSLTILEQPQPEHQFTGEDGYCAGVEERVDLCAGRHISLGTTGGAVFYHLLPAALLSTAKQP